MTKFSTNCLNVVLLFALTSELFPLVFCESILHPLLFMPGDGGSRLYSKLDKPSSNHWYCAKKSDWSLFWVEFDIFVVPWPRNCFLENIELVFNHTDNTTYNQPGVELKVDDPGNVTGIMYLDNYGLYDYYGKMINHFTDKGYKTGKDLMGISYDFRKCPNENQDILDAMKTLTEEMFFNNQNKSVYIVSHSMGGLYTKRFLEQQPQSWKDQFVAGWISIATPMYGASSSYEMMASGYNFDVPTLPAEPLKYAQRSYTSSAWMLPNPNFWDTSETMIQTPTRNYTVLDYKQFFSDINYTLGYTVYDLTHKILNFEPPEVNLFCIYGIGIDTADQFIYDDSFPDNVPVSVVNADGDGSVVFKSASGCGKFIQSRPIVEKSFSKVNHNGLLTDDDVISYVDKIVFTM
ncbi:phosphatidylcholine-sterol acyltransferase-like [Convolutriloba macropyga]|uniref:phosphatidylcholine-sterol acyltransferase-like n=1 Tax=Convolutriloba macropyga TaxID=536237 RepID=UPI003F51B0B1